VHTLLIARPLAGPRAPTTVAVSRLADGLRLIGATPDEDIVPVVPSDPRAAADTLARELDARWSTHVPDVVHAHGWIACVAALQAARGRVPVVVTVDEPSGLGIRDEDVFRAADALVVRSTMERDGWLALDVPVGRVSVVPLPVEVVAQVPAVRGDPPVVVTDARGRVLERIVLSMRSWPADARLAVLGPMQPAQRDVLHGLATWATDRIDVVEPSEDVWAKACLVVAGPSGARHAGLVLEGAAHGVPAVASDIGAYCDVVVDGATGVLLPPALDSGNIGEAVGDLLRDPLRLRGYGLAARLRARAAHDPRRAAERCLVAYEHAVTARLGAASGSGDGRDGGPALRAAPVRLTSPELAWQDLVVEHLAVARRLAHKYAGRGQSVEDLVQVANLGLVKAAQRFEPEQGTPFIAYAVPTMLGELRRYFRDNAWAIHVPRSVQETALRVRHAGDRLRQSLGHEVDATEIAHDLGLSLDEVLEARNASGVAFACRSLDAALMDEGDSRLSEILGSDDVSLEHIEARESLRRAFGRLPAREREILVLRFFGELTQSEIAEQLGISQMHVSRLLARTLQTLREHVVEDVPLPAGW
jgi:RNA polymerase sigma-B factor